jgi:hypothetical protein
VLSAVGGIESSGGILEDTIDFMTGIERVVKCTKEGRCGEGKNAERSVEAGPDHRLHGERKRQSEAGKPGRNPGRRLLSLLKSSTHRPATDRSP